jgi:hypothetical protein
MKINGNLDFFALGQELRNAVIEKLAADPTGEVGRIYYNTAEKEYRYFNGTSWLPFGEGQLAEKLEGAMGGITTIEGDYDAAAVNSALSNLDTSGATTLLDALKLMDQARKDNTDAITAANNGAVTYDVGTKQFSKAGTAIANLSLADKIKLEVAEGFGAAAPLFHIFKDEGGKSLFTKIEGNSIRLSDGGGGILFIRDDTININGNVLHHLASGLEYTPKDATSTLHVKDASLADYITNLQNSSLAPKKYIDDAITTVTGNLNSLALDGLSDVDATTGKVARATLAVNTAGDGFELIAARTIETTNTAALTIANGDGIAGNPSLTVDAGLESIAGLTVDADKMIYATGADTYAVTDLTAFSRTLLAGADDAALRTTLGLGSIATEAAADYLAKAGGTMAGDVNMDNHFITNVKDPVNSGDAANKGYVDGAVAGLSWKNPVRVATTVEMSMTSPVPTTIDGVSLVDGDRILFKDQTDAGKNGIYVYDAAGTKYVRSTDMDATSPINEVNGAAVLVLEGSNKNRSYTVVSTVTAIGDNIDFAAFSGAASINAGTGLVYTGNTIDVLLGAGIKELPTDGVGIDLQDPTTGALILTDNGTTRGDLSADDKLALLLNTAGGLEQNVDGLAIKATGVTLAMLATKKITLAGKTGTGEVVLGDELTITGNDPIDVLADNGTFTISAKDATDAIKGVASFAADDFTVTGGVVTMNDLDAASVTNAMLVNSTMAFSDDDGTSVAIALGETLQVKSGNGLKSVVDAATKTVTFSADIATDALLGSVKVGTGLAVAADGTISIASGASATTLAALTDVTAAANDTAGNILVANGTDKYATQAIQFIGDYTTAATTHTVSHNLGQKFVTVTVYDEDGKQILPQEVALTDANGLTVKFNQSIKCTVVVMGVPGLAVTTV